MRTLLLILLLASNLNAADAPAWTATIDSRVAVYWPAIVNRQSQYKSNNEGPGGRYWQGLPSHSEIPVEGAEQAPDRENAVAPGHSKSLRQMLPALPAKFSAQYEVHNYRGPAGDGFTLIVRGKAQDGTVWARHLHYGAETWREKAWHVERSAP